jgi:hypothetical protein
LQDLFEILYNLTIQWECIITIPAPFILLKIRQALKHFQIHLPLSNCRR